MRTAAIAVHLDAGSLLVCEAIRKQGAGFEVHDGAPIAQTATVAVDQQRVAVEIKQSQQSSSIWQTFHWQPLKSNSHHKVVVLFAKSITVRIPANPQARSGELTVVRSRRVLAPR
jgi:hypothetical protein